MFGAAPHKIMRRNPEMTYEIDIAGLKRNLPLCPLNDTLSIGAFVMFGDVELTVHCAAELLKSHRTMII